MAAKLLEKQLNIYISKLIYAVFDDIMRSLEGENPYDLAKYQSYGNLIKDKAIQTKGLTSRFTISDSVKQFLSFLFNKMIEEIKNTDINDNDNIAIIRVKARNANSDCYIDFMYGMVEQYKDNLGATLRSANDPSMWFHNHIIGCLPKYVTKHIICAAISTEFDMFLKVLAFIIGKFIWYYKVSVSAELFLGLIAPKMNQIMIDMMNYELRPKAPGRSRVKKTTTNVTINNSNVVFNSGNTTESLIHVKNTPSENATNLTDNIPADQSNNEVDDFDVLNNILNTI